MIENVPESIINALDSTCGEIVCAEVFCGDYDREEVWKYLVETTNISENEKLKNFIINKFDGDFFEGLCVGNSEIDESEYDEMLDGSTLEDATLSFDFEEILEMEYTHTDKGIFVTTNSGYINDGEYAYGEEIKPTFDMLKKKFPGITYTGLRCYLVMGHICNEFVSGCIGDAQIESKEVNDYFITRLNNIDYNEYIDFFEEEKKETMDFLIDNDLNKAVEKYINTLLENDDFEDYLSSEEFADAIHTLCKKKQLSFDFSIKMIGHDRISTPMKAELLEYVHKNFPDRDVMSEYSID